MLKVSQGKHQQHYGTTDHWHHHQPRSAVSRQWSAVSGRRRQPSTVLVCSAGRQETLPIHRPNCSNRTRSSLYSLDQSQKQGIVSTSS